MLEKEMEVPPKETMPIVKEDAIAGYSGVRAISVHSAREKALTITFGEKDCSASSLRMFLDHYMLARVQNVRKNEEDGSILNSERINFGYS